MNVRAAAAACLAAGAMPTSCSTRAALRAHADALPPDVPPALRPLVLRMLDPVQRAATLRARRALRRSAA